MKNRIMKDDYFGRFIVKKPDGIKWDSYYNTIDILRQLFQSKYFNDVITGFYLNISGDFDSVRISYFVEEENIETARSIFKKFFQNNSIVEIGEEHPKKILLAADYGGLEYEEMFRHYLHVSTQIGLDLIKENLSYARILFAIYRWQVRKASLSFKNHFEPAFKKYSSTYRSLPEDEKVAFLNNLKEWPNPPQVDWAHMMVNFVLGCDWNGVFRDPYYLTPGKPLPIEEINKIIKPLGLQIPSNWKP